MAEIEHFVDPRDKSHQRFGEIEHVEITMYSAKNQSLNQAPEKISIGQAVKMVELFINSCIFLSCKIDLWLLN